MNNLLCTLLSHMRAVAHRMRALAKRKGGKYEKINLFTAYAINGCRIFMCLWRRKNDNSLKKDDISSNIGDNPNVNFIDFTLSDKTTSYYDVQREMENKLYYVTSLSELNELQSTLNFNVTPEYENSFFDEYVLILHFFTAPDFNDIVIELTEENNVLYLDKNYIITDGTISPAIRNWAFLVEVKKSDITDITAINTVKFSNLDSEITITINK